MCSTKSREIAARGTSLFAQGSNGFEQQLDGGLALTLAKTVGYRSETLAQSGSLPFPLQRNDSNGYEDPTTPKKLVGALSNIHYDKPLDKFTPRIATSSFSYFRPVLYYASRNRVLRKRNRYECRHTNCVIVTSGPTFY